MARETDWHVFDKACDITAMAVRGSGGNGLTGAYVADLFREIHQALAAAAAEMEGEGQKAGF